jgi:hypothetical protein
MAQKGRLPALQAQSPEFKSQSHLKNKSIHKSNLTVQILTTKYIFGTLKWKKDLPMCGKKKNREIQGKNGPVLSPFTQPCHTTTHFYTGTTHLANCPQSPSSQKILLIFGKHGKVTHVNI